MQFDDANWLSARLLRAPQPPRAIQPYDVPLLLQVRLRYSSEDLRHSDMMMLFVFLLYIVTDGGVE